MRLVVFGLAISSSWGNGHATLWRGLCAALSRRGHHVTFFEKNVSYYADNRDRTEIAGCDLRIYHRWDDVVEEARAALDDADVGMVTSYCPDGVAAGDLVIESLVPLSVFYDLDTPVTLERMRSGHPVPYIGPSGLGRFDLVLSYTGGAALAELKSRLGARRTAPLYGSVDPEVHRPALPEPLFTCDLSYLGTYAADRQEALEQLFVEPARRLPEARFIIGGAQYPEEFPWTSNIFFMRHLPPEDHPVFYCSARLTLNVTRGAMQSMGYCPSGRLFEAAACGTPVLTDDWEGLDQFFEPETEVLLTHGPDDTIEALLKSDDELAAIAEAARKRVLRCHTSDRRAEELESLLTHLDGGASNRPRRSSGAAAQDAPAGYP
jgi:spore maturation protein CgeB